MRSSTLYFGAGTVLAGLANAACTPCGSVKCLDAIALEPAVGESFCSSYLSLAPVTTTVTEVEVVTSTQVGVETSIETVTVTSATVTVTTGAANTIFQKRVATSITDGFDEPAPTSSPEDPKAVIVSKCSNKEGRISKACHCFLSTATASTVTVTETARSTDGAQATSIVLSTVTENVIATVSVAPPARTIAANIIVNGAFEKYLTTGNILPWTNSVATTGGQLQVINGVNPCVAAGDCAGGQVVVRAYPPRSSGGSPDYVAIKETFDGKASTTYNVSFLMRCLNYDATSKIDVYYKGALIGSANQCFNSAAFYRPAAGSIKFTTDATGTGELEVRFRNPSGLQYLYYYADDFKATAVVPT
ncbi:hypothetical protein QBC43DRAFT_381399 [Cladorrhinum sp. PSN259]|nr:hypothetical protein QBC43DRAFT_381399 [Cladorrhinum sp. PSN259]